MSKGSALCVVLAALIAAATLYYYYPKLADYKRGRDIYHDISERYTASPAGGETSDPPAGSGTQEPAVPTPGEADAGASAWDTFSDFGTVLKSINPDLDAEEYGCISVNGEALKKDNPDYAGWIHVPKTSISYPVVLSKDNKDYLHVSFNKEANNSGTIFIDCRNTKTIYDRHMVLYGHNMRDGSMFAQIKSYVDEEFMEQHPVIWFITPAKKLLYRVFSAYEASPSDTEVTYAFEGEEFKTESEWDAIIKKIKERSEVETSQEVGGSDYAMTLSTCTNARSTRITPTAVLIGEYTG